MESLKKHKRHKTLDDFRKQVVIAKVKSGKPMGEVGKDYGVCRTTVWKICKETEVDSEFLEKFRKNKKDVLLRNQIKRMQKQDVILDSLGDEDLKSADLRTKGLLLNVLGIDRQRESIQEREVDGSAGHTFIYLKAVYEARKQLGMEDEGEVIEGEAVGGREDNSET